MSVAKLKERHTAATQSVNALCERLKEKHRLLLDTDVSGYARSQGKTPMSFNTTDLVCCQTLQCHTGKDTGGACSFWLARCLLTLVSVNAFLMGASNLLKSLFTKWVMLMLLENMVTESFLLSRHKVEDFQCHKSYFWGGTKIKVWLGKVESLSI